MQARIAFAGDRDIAVKVLEFLVKRGVKPIALILPDEKKGSHVKELLSLCPDLSKDNIFFGDSFRSKESVERLGKMNLDYIISIHFQHIYPKEVLEMPKRGVLNLHPAFLPYNRGWHTASWAIIEKTIYGATLHFMSEKVDEGDIVYQDDLEVLPDDTADSLYKRVKELELEVFKKAWPSLESFKYNRRAQGIGGTSHKKADLAKIQEIRPEERVAAGELIDRIRALTTNNEEEAAFFRINGRKYRMQIKIRPEE